MAWVTVEAADVFNQLTTLSLHQPDRVRSSVQADEKAAAARPPPTQPAGCGANPTRRFGHTQAQYLSTSEIRDRLKSMGVDSSDCFDRESLVQRYSDEARKFVAQMDSVKL